jgi:uncharacterized protein
VIVFDASTLVSSALKAGSIPERALRRAIETDVLVLSTAVDEEIAEVLNRAKFSRSLSRDRRENFLETLRRSALWFEPTVSVRDCRDVKDNKYLELAATAGADVIVSGDNDLLVLQSLARCFDTIARGFSCRHRGQRIGMPLACAEPLMSIVP